jgi:transcriptional regulator with XRE-family HTH domain
MFFSSNLKLLRKRRGLTQEDLARALNIKRPTLNNYENKVSGPPLDVLTALSDFFALSMDTLVRIDLTKLSGFQLKELEQGNDVYVRGSRLRVLTSTVGPDNEENIELVPEKAKAGYLTGFSDPEYISLNPLYEPYDLLTDEIREVWRFVHFISSELPQGKVEAEHLLRSLSAIQSDVGALKAHLLNDEKND